MTETRLTENAPRSDDQRTESQAAMLFNRLQKRQRHLRKWAARAGAGVYRLYDRDIPEIPLVLDFYHNDETAAVSGALYKRPYDKSEDEE
ncbi:MAG: rRNA (guanine-N2)-methyltransferase, partial [Spirochaetaceae bacterium]|nr:rRNA (guanine-N2)-methyltransferase [Spirochaetaceae bacterium]